MKFRPQVLKKTVDEYKVVTSKLINPDLAKEIFGFVFEKLTEAYVLLYLQDAEKFTKKNILEVITKVEHNYKAFCEKCTSDLVESPKDTARFFEQFKNFVTAEDLDQIIVSLMNLQVYFPKLEEPQTLTVLVKSKLYVPPETVTYIVNHFIQPKENINKIITKHKTLQLRKKSFNNALFTIIFLLKISILIRTCNTQEK